MSGWLKLHRELMHKAIWKTSSLEQKVILITLLMMANHSESEWEWKGERFIVKPGQVITSLKSIAEHCGEGISQRNVRTAIERFEKYGFLTNESTNKSRLITIVNWESYQGGTGRDDKTTDKQPTSNRQADDKQPTSNRQADDKQPTTNKNDKKNNNINNIYTRACAREEDLKDDPDTGKESKSDTGTSQEDIDDFFEEVWSEYPNKKGKASVSAKTKKALHKLGKEKVLRAIERYKEYVVSEHERGFDLQYQHGSRFFNSGYLDYLDQASSPPDDRAAPADNIIPFSPLPATEEPKRERYTETGERILTVAEWEEQLETERIAKKRAALIANGIDPDDLPFDI